MFIGSYRSLEQKMHIALIEISEPNHYMVMDGLIRTYCEDKRNRVSVILNQHTLTHIKRSNYSSQVILKVLEANEDLKPTILKIRPDRIHICSGSRYQKQLLQAIKHYNHEIFFHFHNIETWFSNPVKYQIELIKKKVANKAGALELFQMIKYSIKKIAYSFWAKKLIKEIVKKNSYYVTLSQIQESILERYLTNPRFIRFPSLITERDLPKEQRNSDQINICIPGTVQGERRDYQGFLKSVLYHQEIFRSIGYIELLGRFDGQNKTISDLILEVKSAGIKLLYHDYFLDPTLYSERISQCDVLLGNILIRPTDEGQLKETGTVYNMVSYAKPGLFPKGFILDDLFDGSYIQYQDYEHLASIINDMQNKPEIIEGLKKSAANLSEKFTPSALLKRLKVGNYPIRA